MTERRLKVLFASSKHFVAGYELTLKVCEERGLACDVVQSLSSLHEDIRDADVVVPLMEKIDSSVLAVAQRLKLVIQFGVGLEGVDVEGCTSLGIAVANIPSATSENATATAEHGLFLTMWALRKGMESTFQSQRLGGRLTTQLAGKTVCVVGHGSVGKRLSTILRCLGARTIVAHAHRSWREGESCEGDERVTLEERGDALAVVLCCPLTSETRGMVNDGFVRGMRYGSILVNVGRGPLVQRNAVLDALNSGQVGAFASDVGIDDCQRPSEPWDPSDPISLHPNALFTPHVGGYSDKSYSNMAHAVADAVQALIDGKSRPKNCVN